MTNRDRLRRLVDELPEESLAEAERLLTILKDAPGDYVLHAYLTAPEPDEPLRADEGSAMEEGRSEISRDYLSTEEANERLRSTGAEEFHMP